MLVFVGFSRSSSGFSVSFWARFGIFWFFRVFSGFFFRFFGSRWVFYGVLVSVSFFLGVLWGFRVSCVFFGLFFWSRSCFFVVFVGFCGFRSLSFGFLSFFGVLRFFGLFETHKKTRRRGTYNRSLFAYGVGAASHSLPG